MITAPSKSLLRAHHVCIASDSPFQSQLRLRQALWREREGLPIGEHRGVPLGSRLALPYASETLSNYLTETIRQVVRREVVDLQPGQGKLYARPRIFNDLLSSQPMCTRQVAAIHASPTTTLRRGQVRVRPPT